MYWDNFVDLFCSAKKTVYNNRQRIVFLALKSFCICSCNKVKSSFNNLSRNILVSIAIKDFGLDNIPILYILNLIKLIFHWATTELEKSYLSNIRIAPKGQINCPKIISFFSILCKEKTKFLHSILGYCSLKKKPIFGHFAESRFAYNFKAGISDTGTINSADTCEWIQQQILSLKQMVEETGLDLGRCRQEQVAVVQFQCQKKSESLLVFK